MITRRGVLGGTLAATVGAVTVEAAVPNLESIEAKAADLARDMQAVLGGRWRYAIDPISKNLFVTQFSSTDEVKKRR